MNRREILKGSLFAAALTFLGIKAKPVEAITAKPQVSVDPLADVEVRIQFLRDSVIPIYDKEPGQTAYVFDEDGGKIIAVTKPPRVIAPPFELAHFKEHHLSDSPFPHDSISAGIAEAMRVGLSSYLVQLVETARANGTNVNCVTIPIRTNLTVLNADDPVNLRMGWSTFMHLNMVAMEIQNVHPTGNPWGNPQRIGKMPKYGRIPKAHEMTTDIRKALGLHEPTEIEQFVKDTEFRFRHDFDNLRKA